MASAEAFVRGLAFGFAIAATPGPIFFLCLKRALSRGPLHGLISGFGAATADGFYAAVAAFGIAAVTDLYSGERRAFGIAGGLVLIFLGVRILVEKPKAQEDEPENGRAGLALAYLSTLGLTIANPATIVSFAALAATLGVAGGAGLAAPSLLVVGVLAGSALSWCALAAASAALRSRLTPRLRRAISIASGVVIAALGLVALITAWT